MRTVAAYLGGRGYVVYLYTTVDQQFARTQKGRERPLLENGDRREILEKLLLERDPHVPGNRRSRG